MFSLLLSLATASLVGTCAPQVLIHNARIETVEASAPRAQAMVIDSCGLIVAVGADQALKSRYAELEQLDAAGAALVPGFIDAHGHLMGLGHSLLRANLQGAASKAETLQRLQAFAADLPAGAWLLGRGWDQNDWPEKSFPTKSDLDELFPQRPVWLTRIDGHADWGNSAALAEADRDFSGTWQPEGGEIMRDADGEATGVFIDRARALVAQHVPAPDEALERLALTRALRHAAEQGLTAVHDAGTSKTQLQRLLKFAQEGLLPLRVYAMADGDQDLFDQLCEAPVHTDQVIARSVKLYADGALGSRGAALLADYSDRPGNRGLLLQSPQELARQASRAMGCGLQVNIHAIGDHANQVALNVLIEAAGEAEGTPDRHRIEHAQVIAPADIKRFAQHGIIASIQPTHATSDMYWAQERLGLARLEGAYLSRALLDQGGRIALGSDFPVENAAPLLGLYAAVSRQDASGWPADGWRTGEALSPIQALRGFTLDAAYAAFMEQQTGSLEAGKQADFVVLSHDLTSTPVAQWLTVRPLVTVIGGKVSFIDSSAASVWSRLPGHAILE